RRDRDQERFHQETPDRAVATKRQDPPSLVPEGLPLVSPCSKASYATGFHPSVLTYDPLGAGRLLPREARLVANTAPAGNGRGDFGGHDKQNFAGRAGVPAKLRVWPGGAISVVA